MEAGLGESLTLYKPTLLSVLNPVIWSDLECSPKAEVPKVWPLELLGVGRTLSG